MHKSEREKMHVHGERNLRARERERELRKKCGNNLQVLL